MKFLTHYLLKSLFVAVLLNYFGRGAERAHEQDESAALSTSSDENLWELKFYNFTNPAFPEMTKTNYELVKKVLDHFDKPPKTSDEEDVFKSYITQLLSERGEVLTKHVDFILHCSFYELFYKECLRSGSDEGLKVLLEKLDYDNEQNSNWKDMITEMKDYFFSNEGPELSDNENDLKWNKWLTRLEREWLSCQRQFNSYVTRMLNNGKYDQVSRALYYGQKGWVEYKKLFFIMLKIYIENVKNGWE